MAQFISCPSCGKCISVYVEFVEAAKQALVQSTVLGENSEIKDYDAEKLALNSGSAPPLEEIFDALDIKLRCCRMRLTSKMEIDKLYI